MERQPAGPALVDRRREIAELEEALALARGGHGRVFLIAGEPGIGKTRLAEAVAERAEAEGMLACWGRCWDSGGQPPFWPWVQALRAVFRSREPKRLRRELGPNAGLVARVVPELRDVLTDVEVPDSIDSDQARFALFDAISSFLCAASRSNPLVLVLDDLHSADRPSLSLLEFFAPSVGDVPMLLLAAYQEAAAHMRPEVESLIGSLGRSSRPIVLRGFAPGDLASLIEPHTGGPPPSDFVGELHSTTEGNPFFASEVVRLLAAEGQLELWVAESVRARFPLPDTVLETIRLRFEPLGERGAKALEAAAVIGREFRIATLAQALGAGPEELIAPIDDAVDAGLVTEVPGMIGRFRFAHGLIRDALYASLSNADRIRLHRAVGEALQQTYGDTPEHLTELAHHFAEASAGGDADVALGHVLRAGKEAMRMPAYEQAAELFELALQVSELLAPDANRRAELLLALGQARTRADDARARDTVIAAADAARAADRTDVFTSATLAMRAFPRGTGVIDDVPAGLLSEALEREKEGDPAVRAGLLARLAVAFYYHPGTSERREQLVDEAVALARERADPATLAYVLSNAQLALWGPDTTERDLGWTEELLRLTEGSGSAELALATRNRQIDYLVELDDLPAAEAALRALERMAAESPDPRAKAYLPLQRARQAVIDGRYDEAEALNREAAKVGARLRDPTIRVLVMAQLVGLRWFQGRLEDVEEVAREIAHFDATPAWPAAVALICCEIGHEAEGRRRFEAVLAHGLAALPRYNGWLISLALLAETCSRLGDAERARELYGLLEPFSGRNVISPHAIFAGPVSHYLGVLAATAEEWDAAAGHFDGVRAWSALTGSRPVAARVDLEQARMLHARGAPGDREEGIALLNSAERVHDELGAVRMVEHVVGLREEIAGGEPVELEPSSVETGSLPGRASLCREGDMWTFDYERRVVRVKDGKGIQHIAMLLDNPGVEMHALYLAAPGHEPGPLAPRVEGSDAGPVLDDEAKGAYRRRLEELSEELEEAESFNDPERAAQAREEIDFLETELAGALGLGGRDRKTASSAERARVSVTKAIRSTLKRIGEHDPVLGRELGTTVRTGTFCVYEPDPRRPIVWQVESG
jgi:tetratricopeptide (TPR) repeat protein